MGSDPIMKDEEVKDLHMIIQNNLSSEKNRQNYKTHKLQTNIKVAFHYIDEDMKKLIVAMIKPRLEYVAIAWCQHKKKSIIKVEGKLREATMMLGNLK